MTGEPASRHRAKEGIVICLRDLGDGSSRLMIDDVIADNSEAENPIWRHKAFYTTNTYPNQGLDKMALSDEEFAQIGVAVIARLLAINGRVSE